MGDTDLVVGEDEGWGLEEPEFFDHFLEVVGGGHAALGKEEFPVAESALGDLGLGLVHNIKLIINLVFMSLKLFELISV